MVLTKEYESPEHEHGGEDGDTRKTRASTSESSTSAAQRPMTGNDRIVNMASRGTTFFHKRFRLKSTLVSSHSRDDHDAAAIQTMVATSGIVVETSRVVGIIRGGPIEELRVNGIHEAGGEQMSVKPLPAA